MPDHNSTAMSEEQSLLSAEIVNRGITNSGPDAGSLSFSVQVRRRLPDFLQSINLKYVKLGYHYLISHGVYLLTAPAAVLVASAQIGQLSWEGAWSSLDVETVTFVLGLLILTVYVCFKFSPRATYLVDFTCYRPPDDYKVSKKEFIELAKKSGNFEDASLELQQRVLKKSGIGDESYLPKSIISSPSKSVTMAHTREEASLVIFGAIDNLLSVTKILPKDISVLVVNCGIFNPTPSLASMIINHYKLRSSIQSFNLGGMGCASGIIAVDLARNLLAAYPGSYALVVSTEIITATWYPGQDPAMLLPNCFFRMGSAAVLLTNKRFYRHRCKYELRELVRTQKANDDRSFRCVMQQEDQYKKKGLVVSRDILEVGGHALKDHITTLGPLVLPLSEQFNFFSDLLFRKPKSKPYIPDYKLAFEHVCILAASRTVLEEIQKNLDLTEEYMEASKMTLYRFGNTSSSSVWYQLAYSEAKGKVKKGDKVWQIAFGAGFKCNSVVWKALKDVRRNKRNIWVDGLEDYPVRL